MKNLFLSNSTQVQMQNNNKLHYTTKQNILLNKTQDDSEMVGRGDDKGEF